MSCPKSTLLLKSVKYSAEPGSNCGDLLLFVDLNFHYIVNAPRYLCNLKPALNALLDSFNTQNATPLLSTISFLVICIVMT